MSRREIQAGLFHVSKGVHAYLKEKEVPQVWHVDGQGHDPAHVPHPPRGRRSATAFPPAEVFLRKRRRGHYVPHTMDVTGDFPGILKAAGAKDGWPSEDLLPLVYDELRSLAAMRMRGEAQGQTLQATALVHEAWLKLAAGGERTWADRAHFFRAAAQAMRRILVDRARAKGRIKRGEGRGTIDIHGLEIVGATPDERVLLVDEVLGRMETEDPESARLVSLKFFGGLTDLEIASMEGIAERTVRRRWAFAKVRLFHMIHEAMA